jgi:Family of unknown function (DUF5994)
MTTVTGTRSFADRLDVSPAASSAQDKSDMAQPGGMLRLQLAPSLGRGALDGAWWPYSRDLRTEALDLVNHFPVSAGKIFRVNYSSSDWVTGPGRIRADEVFVTLSAFPRDDTHRVLLSTLGGRQVIQLLVVPPESDSRMARHVMRIAATLSNRRSAANILAESDDPLRTGSLEHWEDDGGPSAPRFKPPGSRQKSPQQA